VISVVAAIIRRNGKILITRRFNDVHLPGLWEFPGGKVEPHESLISALKREILEELGVAIQVEEECFTVDHAYPTKSIRLHFFNCSIIHSEPKAIGVADLRWVAPAELDAFEFPAADVELVALLRSELSRLPSSNLSHRVD
jgi:mutator protein MutT